MIAEDEKCEGEEEEKGEDILGLVLFTLGVGVSQVLLVSGISLILL